MVSPLVLKLRRRDAVSEREADVLEAMTSEVRTFPRGQALVHEGDCASHSCLLLKGWTSRSKTLSDGRTSITAFNVAGDFVDLHAFLLKPMDHTVVALTDCEVAITPHPALTRLTETEPHLLRLLWLSTLIDAAMHRQWLTALGRLPAPARLAHLLCELRLRLEAVDLTEGARFALPLTQGLLADALGLSTVHVNRSIRELRERELAKIKGGTAEVLDWDSLSAFAEFDPGYLNLSPLER